MSYPTLLLLPLLVLGADGDHDATVHHAFDDIEEWVARFDDPERDGWQKPAQLVQALEIKAGSVLADIGAGTGYFAVHLAAATGPDGLVYAVDVEPAMVEYLKTRAEKEQLPNIRPVLTPADEPGLPATGVDLVLICNTWHHIDDRLNYLKKLGASVRDGGRVVIVDFKEGDLPVGPPADRKLTREAVIAEFKEGGWRLASEIDLLPYQYTLEFKR
jgi:ubiquinone/menaquinone biosynthesis C-methylase UbiE